MKFPAYIATSLFWDTDQNKRNWRPKCHSIIFKNTGDVQVKINDLWVLEPGEETPTISTGHPEVVDMTDYSVSFDPTTSGTAPRVVAVYTQTQPNGNRNGNTVNCENF